MTPVLLTGATGLIGGEILRALLNAGARHVSAIVRPFRDSDVRTRLTERLRRSGLEAVGHESVQVVPGDVRSPGLGLAPGDAERLRRDVEIIIHAASDTSFIRGAECHRTNVLGMQHLIEFARGCPRQPLVVYMSTAANSGAVMHRCLHEEDGCKPGAAHHNDYTHSKAVAEQMLWDSGLPALVLRPSIVFSAGMPDACFARAILWFAPLLYEFEGVPIDPNSRLDAVPISFVVDSTLALLRLPARRSNCYHLSAGPQQAQRCGELTDFTDTYYERAEPLRLFRLADWTRAMHRQFVRTAEQRKIFSMLRHYLPFLNMDVVYDNARLTADLGREAVEVPPFTSYLGELLSLIPHEEALAEALNP